MEKRIAANSFPVFAAFLLAGCSNLVDQHVRQMDVIRAMAADVAGRLADGSAGQISASGQALEPGIAVEAAIVYRADAYYRGLAGQYSLSAAGQLADRELPAEVLAIVNDARLGESERLELVRRLLGAFVPSTKNGADIETSDSAAATQPATASGGPSSPAGSGMEAVKAAGAAGSPNRDSAPLIGDALDVPRADE